MDGQWEATKSAKRRKCSRFADASALRGERGHLRCPTTHRDLHLLHPISILPFPPPVFALDDATEPTGAHLLSITPGCRRSLRSESGETAKRACCSTAQSLIWHRKDAPTNPRGIPFAPFVDKVEDYVSSRSEVDGTMKNFQEMIS